MSEKKEERKRAREREREKSESWTSNRKSTDILAYSVSSKREGRFARKGSMIK